MGSARAAGGSASASALHPPTQRRTVGAAISEPWEAALMQELFPVVSGVVLGIVVAGLRPSLRLWVGVLLSVVLGLCATVLSGEFEVSWDYLLVDIPLVAVSAGLSFTLARMAFLRLRRANPS
jgi:hypothetical protein